MYLKKKFVNTASLRLKFLKGVVFFRETERKPPSRSMAIRKQRSFATWRPCLPAGRIARNSNLREKLNIEH